MTIWSPGIQGREGPRYRVIADILAEDIAQGRLKPDDRLPTHRDLAYRLGVTIGTITRAYAEAERRGLVHGHVGRGTFVKGQSPSGFGGHGPSPHSLQANPATSDGLIDLGHVFPTPNPADTAINEALIGIADRPDFNALMAYQFGPGNAGHQIAGAAWMERAGLRVPADRVVVCSGAQNGILLALAAVTQPGDLVLGEALSYYGFKSAASLLNLRMHGVALDEYGVRPDAFAAACRAHAPKALYLVPTLQNPTAAVMPPERRAEIAEIARKHDVIVIEDDIYGFLMEQPLKPISALIPEHSLYITSLSKCIAPGLRIGYVAAPERYFDRVVAALHASSWMAPPMMAEASSILINNGGAARMAAWQRREAAARQTLARQILGDADYDSHPNAPLLWLKLPDPWRGEEFAGQARRRGVAISAAEVFAVGRQSMPHAVRICLTTPHERNDLVRALKIIAELLKEAPAPGLSIF